MRFFPALILALLLCGCAGQQAAVPAAVTEPLSTPTVGYYDSSPLEVQTNGAVRVYPLDLPDAYSIRVLDEHLLVLSLDGNTQLTLLTGDTLIPSENKQLPFPLAAEDLYIHGSEIVYYDPTVKEIHVLDASLNTIRSYAAPEDLVGTPVLSESQSTLYYCTADALRAWDLETGIRRCLKDLAYEAQSVTGVHMDGTVIECTIRDNGQTRTLFLSTDNGSLLLEHDGDIDLQTRDGCFYAVFPCGSVQTLVFGSGDTAALTPRDLGSDTVFLPLQNAAVSVYAPSDNRLRMEYYLLEDGRRTASLEWQTEYVPESMDASGNHVFFLSYDAAYDRKVIYRWEPAKNSLSDSRCYTGPYYSSDNPDTEGLFRCETYANLIGQQHSIQIKIGWEATEVQPWDYDLEAEYLVPVLEEELHLLEQRLSHYPNDVLADTAAHFSSLTICLVRSIRGSAESGSLDTATGIQFFDGTDAYVVIAPGKFAGQALYHEMFHVMETHLLTQDTALDRWEELNPTGFRYDYSYITNKNRDAGVYLRNDSRAFVDTYSMSFPKEDRARVMEYAMLAGQETLFHSPTMQAKLQCLSDSLREAYGLTDSEETFLWEQYLEK